MPTQKAKAGPARRKCQVCGKTKPCQHVPDPFGYELYGDETPIWICADCYMMQQDQI